MLECSIYSVMVDIKDLMRYLEVRGWYKRSISGVYYIKKTDIGKETRKDEMIVSRYKYDCNKTRSTVCCMFSETTSISKIDDRAKSNELEKVSKRNGIRYSDGHVNLEITSSSETIDEDTQWLVVLSAYANNVLDGEKLVNETKMLLNGLVEFVTPPVDWFIN